jgi:hypothetical protein
MPDVAGFAKNERRAYIVTICKVSLFYIPNQNRSLKTPHLLGERFEH